ncbi:MAG: helix-turn-helix transcriptional regulator [Clostridia bacterium]|nr:helix-turn-helix transcriptional regulator [Clostridia bacterium]
MYILLKTEFRNLALTTRYKLGLTQREMAEMLSMSERSYSDIEGGKTSCGTLTSILLIQMQDDPYEFLSKLKDGFQRMDDPKDRVG